MLSSPNAGMQAPLGPVGTSQPAAPAISSGTHIDPSSMQRAYAALGLPYGNQPAAQTQVAGQQPTQTQQQQMRSMTALGINFWGNLKCYVRLSVWYLRKSGILWTIQCSMFIINLESCCHSVTSSCIILNALSHLLNMHTSAIRSLYCILQFLNAIYQTLSKMHTSFVLHN